MEVVINGNESVTDLMRKAAEDVFTRLSEKFEFTSPLVNFEINDRFTEVSLRCKSKNEAIFVKSKNTDFYQSVRAASKMLKSKLKEVKDK
jgi:ribosome-associated translation inhibitor RaiA